jgi:capsid portal protein
MAKFSPDCSRDSIYEIEEMVSPIVSRRGDDQDTGSVSKGHQQAAGSQQIPDKNNIFPTVSSSVDIIPPPIDFRLWASQLARSTRLNRGVRTLSRNTVGLGWDVVPKIPFTEKTPDEEKVRILEEVERVSEFFDGINPEKPFNTLMECETIDEEATGNGYLEFTRTGGGNLDKAFHVMSTTMRILRGDRGYLQERNGERRYFKKFGDDRVMNAANGLFSDEEGFLPDQTAREFNQAPLRPTAPVMQPRTQEEADFRTGRTTALPLNLRATEIMHFKLYHPMSEHYGLPRFISAGAAIAGNFHSARRNVSFFQNDAVPRMAVLVSGGTLDPASRKDVTELFQEGMGADQAHRILILQTTSEGVGVDDKNTTKIDLRPLTVNSTEDGSFLNYRRANNEEIREALGLSEVYFKSEKLTKASAVVAKATTDEQEFEPARLLKEHIINRMIVINELGAKDVSFKFKRPEVSDPTEKAQVHKEYSDMGALSANEIRRELGKEPFPPTEEWANLPTPYGLLAVSGQITEASALKVEPPKEPAPAAGNPAQAPKKAKEEGTEGESADNDPDDANAKSVLPGTPETFLNKTRETVESITKLPDSLKLGRT